MSSDVNLVNMSGFLAHAPQRLSAQALTDNEEKTIPVISGIAAALPLIGTAPHTGDPPWNPARKIITFMGIVCLICTLIVVGIVLLAIYLSRQIEHSRYTSTNDILYTVPKSHSKEFIDINQVSSSKIRRQVSQLEKLLDTFSAVPTQFQAEMKCSWCHVQFENANRNCSVKNNFGYYSQHPCVALVFKPPVQWLPEPFESVESADHVPRFVKDIYDPGLVLLSCHTEEKDVIITYTPDRGFPMRAFGSPYTRDFPPFVLLQIHNVPLNQQTKVTCFIWTKNVKTSDRFPIPGHLVFIIQS